MHDTKGNTFASNYSGRDNEYINSISRGDLNGMLLTEADTYDNLTIHFNTECETVDLDTNTVHFVNRNTKETFISMLFVLVCYFVLSRTQAGNWIYSTGGNLSAAQANGVPTNKVKISLFMFTAFCATMFAACQVFEVNTSDAAKGNLKELEAIAAAVIGGVVLTGGFGTVLGIILGAVIFGIAKEAFFYIPGIDGSFYRVFLGAVLVSAALTNENIRKRIIGSV